MPHSLIVGASGTGKTTLAKRLAATRVKSRSHVMGFRQVVLDPMISEWPDGVFVCDNWADLMIELDIMREENEVGCIYIDEANLHFGHSDKANLALMLRGRHAGLDITLITQYPTLLSPAARGQCERLHLFQIGMQSARMLAEDFALPTLASAPALKRGEWLCAEWSGDGHRVANKYLLFDVKTSP